MEKVDLLKIAAVDSAITALLDLTTEYRAGMPLSTVTRFQQIWLELYPFIKSDVAWRKPTENSIVDGLYGAKTGKAMETPIMIVAYKLGLALVWDSKSEDRLLPKRAADLPLWGAKNRTNLTEMRIWLDQVHNPPPPTPSVVIEPEVKVVVAPQEPKAVPVEQPQPAPTTQQTVLMRMTPYQEDNTKLYVAAGLTVVGLGAVYWFVLRKKKKSRRR